MDMWRRKGGKIWIKEETVSVKKFRIRVSLKVQGSCATFLSCKVFILKRAVKFMAIFYRLGLESFKRKLDQRPDEDEMGNYGV